MIATIRAQICARLSRVLGEEVDVHRCVAARALGRIGQAGAAPALMEALLDEDEDVRADAAGALGQLQDPSTGDRLLESLLGDPSPEVKCAALDALVQVRHAKTVPWLIRLIRGKDPEIVWDESDFYESGWDDWADIQVRAITAVGKLRIADAVPDIVAAMNDEFGQDLTETAFPALARIGGAGVEALARFMDSEDERTRRRAATALAASNEPTARTAVARALLDRSIDVRLAAARVLASRDPADDRLALLFSDPSDLIRAEIICLCGKAHARELEHLLDDTAPDVVENVFALLAETPGLLPADKIAERATLALTGPAPVPAAASALAVSAPEDAIDLLAGITADPSQSDAVRCGAIKGLAQCSDPKSVSALAAVVADPIREIRLEAMTALLALARAEDGNETPSDARRILLSAVVGALVPEPELPEEPEAGNSDAAVPSAATEGQAVVEDLSEQMADTASEFPTSTMDAILGTGDPESADTVLADEEQVDLTDTDLDFLRLSGQGPVKRRVAPVSDIAVPQDVRRFAARLLGDMDQNDVAEALAAVLDDRDEELCTIAVDSLAQIARGGGTLRPEVLSCLRRALAGSARDVRLAAMRALGAARDDSAGPAIRKLLGDEDSFLRSGAVDALCFLDETAADAVALLADSDPAVRLAAARAMAGANQPGTLEKLVAFTFAFEGHHRRDAARLLRDLDADAASTRFLLVLDDVDKRRVWQIAMEALEELNPPNPQPRLAA